MDAWDWLWEMYKTEHRIDVMHSALYTFLKPLRYLYNQNPSIIPTEMIPSETYFEQWAHNYLCRFWERVVIPGRKSWPSIDWFLWSEFKEAVFHTNKSQGFFDIHSFRKYRDPKRNWNARIHKPMMKDLVAPLRFLYKKKRKARRGSKLHFRTFANDYLRRLYNEVVSVSGDDSKCNIYLWDEIRTAASMCGMGVIFSNFDKYESIKPDSFHIDNPDLADFGVPLRHIYKKYPCYTHMPRYPKMPTIPLTGIDSLSHWNDNDAADPLLCPAEELTVIVHPVAVQSKMHSPDFERAVKKALTYCIQRGYTWMTSETLAEFFKVDQRNFEKWADDNPAFRCQEGSEPGVFFYRLTPLEDLEMTTEAVSVDEVAEAEAEAAANASAPVGAPSSAAEAALPIVKVPLEVGSDEFEQEVTQFLNESEKLWRSTESIANTLGVDREKMETWMLSQAAFARRPSNKKDDDTVYFGLASRVSDKKAAAAIAQAQATAAANGAATAAQTKAKAKKDKKKQQSSSITQKELLSFGAMYGIRNQLIQAMAFYANGIATRHPEAFAHLTQAEKELDSGLALLKNSMKLEDRKLPPCEEL